MAEPTSGQDPNPGAVAAIAAASAAECYGIVGLASRNPIDGIARLLHLPNDTRGVEVQIAENGIAIDLHVIIQYGTRIPEVARNLQSQVKFAVEQATGRPVRAVNVNVQDLHVTKETTANPDRNAPKV